VTDTRICTGYRWPAPGQLADCPRRDTCAHCLAWDGDDVNPSRVSFWRCGSDFKHYQAAAPTQINQAAPEAPQMELFA